MIIYWVHLSKNILYSLQYKILSERDNELFLIPIEHFRYSGAQNFNSLINFLIYLYK